MAKLLASKPMVWPGATGAASAGIGVPVMAIAQERRIVAVQRREVSTRMDRWGMGIFSFPGRCFAEPGEVSHGRRGRGNWEKWEATRGGAEALPRLEGCIGREGV